MLEQMIKLFMSGFVYPNLTVTGLALGTGLGIVFGAIWLIGYRPPLFRKPWLWAVAASSAILTWAAIAFVQSPLQAWSFQAMGLFWDEPTLMRWLLVAAIPAILLSGLVQEAFKLLPVVVCWQRQNRDMTAETGLVIGAIAGAGFGVFEAVWVLNTTFASGWSWNMVESQGFLALLPFVERLSAVAFHTGASALTGYGLARGCKWQLYLAASFLHGLVNYSVVLLQMQVFTAVQMEIWVAIIAAALTLVVLWLRWRRPAKSIDKAFEPIPVPLYFPE